MRNAATLGQAAAMAAALVIAGPGTIAAAARQAPKTTAPARQTPTAAPDSTRPEASPRPSPPPTADGENMVMPGKQEGTVFRSLTVQGEDRIRLDIDRPDLQVDLDPGTAPGLDPGSTAEVLRRTSPDLLNPLLGGSARDFSPYLAHPWLSAFASGAVARFRPEVRGVERWRLVVADARGRMVTSFKGKGDPPREIAWDGRASDGTPVVPDLTYSYVFEAFDRAGNKRNFVGQGFHVSAFRTRTGQGPVLAFSARELDASNADPRRGGTAPSPLILIEAASWLNQDVHPNRPVRVTATARHADEARSLATSVSAQLAPLLVGDPARVQGVPVVEPDAPEGGTVTIAYAP